MVNTLRDVTHVHGNPCVYLYIGWLGLLLSLTSCVLSCISCEVWFVTNKCEYIIILMAMWVYIEIVTMSLSQWLIGCRINI